MKNMRSFNYFFAASVVMGGAALFSTVRSATNVEAKEDAIVAGKAQSLASDVYFARYGGAMDAMQREVAAKFRMGFDMSDFAAFGEEVWEVRYVREGAKDGPGGSVLACIWVNPKTQKARFIYGMDSRQILDSPVRGEVVSLVKDWYQKNVGKIDPAMDFEMSELVIDYDVPDFVKRGAKIIEVRIKSTKGLHGIMWVNPVKRTIHAIAGAWRTTTAPATQTSPNR